jgi:hypothetical protein
VTLHLPSIVCQVPLLDVYDRIVFPRADEALEASEGVGRPGPLTP